VNVTSTHKARKNLIKSAFAAKSRLPRAFGGGLVVVVQALIIVLITSLFVATSVPQADSKQAKAKEFGETRTLNVFPTDVSSNDWHNADASLTQDLEDHAMYQDFSSGNAAYIKDDFQTTAQPINTESTDEQLPSTNTDTPPDAAGSDVQSEVNEPVSAVPAFKVVTRAVEKYPLLQLSVASETPESINETQITDTPPAQTSETSSTTDVAVTNNELPETGEPEIALGNFDTAGLEKGQVLDGMQLRVSFGARLNDTLLQEYPYVEVYFGTKDNMQSVGTITIDDEVSNAINGGYYLFALPTTLPPQKLTEAQVVFRYHGDQSVLQGLYLDAAWLEINSRIITEEDLKERGTAEQLVHLKEPELAVLESDQINFDRTEDPVFNLRYESQQNFIVRNVLKLVGKGKLSIEEISVSHVSVGLVDVTPKVTITDDNLISIELPKEQLDSLPPGSYEIHILYNENGFTYADSFDFEWGILSINPDKTEYQVGETAHFMMGALSVNGNTVCDAKLNLYITDPAGAISGATVVPSGQCNGNNIVDVPDYTADMTLATAGEYKVYLERVDENGAVIGFSNDSIQVVESQTLSIARSGPTRIYPRTSYPMELVVTSANGFSGVLHERVPASFVIGTTTADISSEGDTQILTWDVDLASGESKTFKYYFDAPDISPYLYNLGAASLTGDVVKTTTVTKEVPIDVTASSTEQTTASSTSTITEQVTTTENGTVFAEHRQWQIASDATGSMLMLWASANIPTGWTCVSCTAGDVFYQRFIVGSSTAGNTGGAATHTHTYTTATVNASAGSASVGNGGANNYSTVAHTHTIVPTIGTANNLPSYRNLVIIQYNSAGEPTSIPTNAIAVFDATVPSGWTRYAAQDGYYTRGESAANRGTTGGSNTHTHTITGTTAGAAGATNDNTGGATSIANTGHTHTISSATASNSSEPPYIEVILGQLNATSTLPNNVITMWTDTPPTDWNTVSGASGAFENKFFKANTTYGTTGGASTHTPANVTGITTSVPNNTTNRGGAGNARSTGAHTHTVDVTGFGSGSLLPQYRSTIFGKRAGGQPPAAPSVTALFDSEKTGTSTPSFIFKTDDPVGTDSLIYQFDWSTSSTFATTVGSRTSDNETGCSPNCFINTVTGGNTSPFNENENIKFTIQTALTDGTTYYWRARAKKSTGTTYGSWSTTYSFTYVSETDPSQWMQTKDAQFSANTFSSTQTSGSDSVQITQSVPNEVLTVYGEGAVTTPRYRIWNGSSWGSELSASDVGGTVQWIRMAAGTQRDEYVMAVQDAVNDVNVQVFNGTTDTWGSVTEVTTTVSDNTRRGFDVAYETTSGDAIIVYCDGDSDPSYRVWNGSTWSSASTITTVSANNCNYIQMASDPTSDEIIMVTRDTGAGYEAQVWNGSSWSNSITLGSMTDTAHEGIAVQYEESGGQGVVVTSNGNTNGFIWTSWNGSEWGTATAVSLGDDFEWGELKRDDGSDKMALCYIDNDSDVGVVRWDGDAWSTFQEIDTIGNTFDGKAVSCEFETTSGRDGYIMVPYSDTANGRYRYWNGTTFSTKATVSTIQDSWEVTSVRAGDGKILSAFHDDTNTQYDFTYWNGTSWAAATSHETNTSVGGTPFRSPVTMAAKVYSPSSGTVTTQPISFTLVPSRPTWGEATWSTTEPNGTDVKLQVLYATSSNAYCNILVPNGSLSGNSTGFDVTASPLNLSGLSTSTYSKLCLRATLSSTNQSNPTLNDWTLSWERQPYLVQSQFRWYANANWINPSDPWPSGGVDLSQNETLPQSYAVKYGEIIRLRMDLRSDNAALPSSNKAFKLQYSETTGLCASTSVWTDVAPTSSSTAIWRGYNNLLASDGGTISTLLLTGSDVGGSYEEENNSSVNPNTISVGNEAEWDWVLQHNGANDGVQYCFRMVNDEGTALDDYEVYPSLLTNTSPAAPSLEKLFDNEQVASTSPWFEFTTTDADNDDLTYEIQVDDTYDFSSTVLDRNSLSNLTEFENIVVTSDKDPFTVGQTVRFKPSSSLTNNTTYYWRVRAKDVNGSNAYGDWSAIHSFTVNTGTTITAWYQTEQEQLDTDGLTDTETTVSDDVILSTGFTTGTTTTTAIDYDDKTTGNAWGNLSWTQDLTHGSIRYRVEYNNNGVWTLVPDSYLPGNATGFTSSPVSLLGLDPQVHNEIRVRANLTDSGGTPRLQSIKVEWGYAVSQPTQITLFDNEKTGTTTPTFTFSTTDPQSDDIQYQFAWSTSYDFTSSSTALSGVNAGFTNTQNGADTSPFFSGNTISYKIQSALTNGTTYWWRVRGRDPSGGNAWSVWSPAHSFTVDTSVTVSTWFQTTDSQFSTDTLNDTEVSGSGGAKVTTTIREAMVAYAEGTVQSPRYRIWNGSTWSTEGSAQSVGGTIRFVETAASKSRDEYIVATQESGGRVRAQVYDGGTDSFGNLNTIIAAVPGTTARGFDIAYEQTSGDALVVACNGTEATYSVWNGSSWSSATTITLAVSGNCNWIKLASDPASDEIILVARDITTGATDYEALVWNGSSWGNSTTMGSMSEASDEGIALEYEESGNQAVAAVSNGNNASFVWKSWNGSAWSGLGTQALSDDFEEGRINRDAGTDNMTFCLTDNLSQITYLRWDGSANSWGTNAVVEATGNGKPGRPADCIYETTSGRDGYIMIPYSDTTNGRYQFWNGTTLSGEGSISTIQDSTEVRAIRTGDGNILSFFYDDVNTQYDFSYWNGTTWSTIETLEGTSITTTAPATIPISAAARKYPTFTSGTVYSSAIDFDSGTGLKWQQASFSDTKPGSSAITYQVEYYDGSDWQLIPNSALSGNSTGFTSSPIDLSAVSRITYNTIRLKASLTCVGGNCPTINDWTVTWAAGINVSGTLKQYNETSSTTSGTIAVAVNGTIQSGKTATVSNGSWTIANVTAFPMDIVTVFVSGAANSAEAVGVTRYDGDGDISGYTLFERHLSLGSNDATTTPLTNANIGLYDFTNSEDLFANVSGSTLTMCADSGCSDAVLYIKSGTYYTPGGRFVTHDFRNNGTFTAGSYTDEVNGSWDNNSSVDMTGSSVVFAATSTTESIDSTGASSASFNNVTLGTTTGSATWTLGSTLDINGNFTVSRGTFTHGNTAITIAGNLQNGSSGVWNGVGTTTFDGTTAATWQDQNSTLQNIGKVVIDGTSKLVTLASNVKSQSITIGANDTLDASTSNYNITNFGNWYNQNNFLARSGTVDFAATSTNRTITSNAKSFYNLTFSGSGSYSFTESTVSVGNDWSVSAGTVTMPTATSTIAGSFTVTGGSFAHNNGTMYFTAASAKTITFLGGAFTNVARNLTFNGAGSWTITDTNATSTNDVLIQQGTVKFPNGVMAIGGKLTNSGGSINSGAGTTAFYSTTAKVLTFGSSALKNVYFNGSGGSWSFSDTNATVNGNLTVSAGTLTPPSGTLYVGGSYTNSATVTAAAGTVEFNATSTGKTINFGSSALYNVNFNSSSGGWTVSQNATTTNNMSILAANSWTVSSGKIFSVGNAFTNNVGGSATTWTGSTLALRGGTYSINAKSNGGDNYATMTIASGAKVSMWNSSASSYNVNSAGYLYSQDHSAVDGSLYIFGTYTRTSGTEYWKYDTDFDGTALSTTSRQANVRFASGAGATFSGATLNITGISSASTTIANQGSGTYSLSITGGTLTAQYYQFTDLGGSGLSLLGTVSVPTMNNGSFTVGAAAGSALTISSTTINASPAKQITGVRFATSTAIAAKNVSQTDGTPTSFWWFKTGYGNLYGEAYDNDTGDPGSIRFDDSNIVITISGTVYSDAGVTPLTGGTCNGSAQSVKVVVNGGTSYTGSCSAADGSYSISGVAFTGDPVIMVYLDNASGGQKGSVVTRTATANITNMDIYANRVIVRHEDVTPLSITNMSVYDSDNDTDLRFNAVATSTSALTVFAGNELYVWKTKTFTPAGVVTLAANAGANSYDGSLSLGNGATFNAYNTSTLTIGGRLALGSNATFSAASTTVLMTATTSGKSITATSSMTFNNLTFNGSGGTWNLGADITANGSIAITAGTVTGTGSISLPYGSISGNGTLSLGAGTTTISRTNTLGGTSPWTFFNLKLGSGTVVGTTTPASSATTTISGRLTIAAAHVLNAGSSRFDLSGTGTVFVEQGTFVEGSGTVRYSGAGANVLSTGYYNLDINSGAGSQAYTAGNTGIQIANNLTIGGTAGSTFNLNSADPTVDVNGSVTIRSNGTLSASDTGTFTIAGSYTNSGTFTSNSGTITFDGTGSINAGSSSFGNVRIATAGSVTVTNTATATASFRLTSAAGFTVSSGQTLAVGGSGFVNAVGGGATTWTGSTLRLYGGGNYNVNGATTSDSYATLVVKDTTQVKLWNSDATSYTVDSTASLYSQDHANVNGDLYIYGAYRKTSGTDHWSYANDFDGTALGGSSRKVNVKFASGASATYTGGELSVIGATTASTTISNQGSGTYSFIVGGSASTTFSYYQIRNTDTNGLTFTGTPTVATLSFGDIELSQNGYSGMTVGGTVINANPAKNFNRNRFALNGAASSTNVTATGTTVSAWRFVNHYGGRDGEAYDSDPSGDPGYISWDNSSALITVSGHVYSDEGSTVSTVCDGSSNRITLRMAGLTSYSTSCNASTGLYTINNVSYGSGDSFIVYIDGVAQKGAVVSQDPVSNISDMSIYENRVIVRHENIYPLTITDMAVWDSSDDADIPFTANTGSPNTLTLPADRKLIVWGSKTFTPGGNVILSGGGAGASYDGTLELFSSAVWTGAGTEALSVGGSFILDASAQLTTANGTTTFTTTGASRTIDLNNYALYHVAFTGSGSWTMTDTTFTANGNVSQSAGAVTLTTGTSTFNGSLIVNGGSINTNNGKQVFAGTGGKILKMNGSNLSTVIFSGGNYTMTDINATSTGSTTIQSGTITLPSGVFSVGRDFKNTGGTITHNTCDLVMRSTVPATLLASTSSLYSIRFAGATTYTLTAPSGVTFADNFTVAGGSTVLLPSATVSVGGSFDATGGTLTNATTTFLFNATATGKTINPGSNNFYAVQISAPTGGYTLTANATTTNNFTLSSVSTFTQQSGKVLRVGGVFTNAVGGSATTWSGTLKLDSGTTYTINTKSTGSDRYQTLTVGANTDIRMWGSSATTTTVHSSGSVYSQNHASVNGYAYIFGDFHVSTSTEYWNYTKDFDGTTLGASRAVTVSLASNASTTVDGGTLQILGASGNSTTITNQGSGTYSFKVTSGTLNAQYYAFRNLNASGLYMSGTPTITSLSNGDYELAVSNGTLITLASTTLNANASLLITGTRFATTTAITGKNVTLSGATSNAWTFSTHTGNLAGEGYDVDGATACGSIRWTDSSCLITQQVHYRWRNDDGGTDVPNSEWYNTSWSARKSIDIDNADATTYTNPVVQTYVTFDSDMRSNFGDLRFTDSDGVTPIPYWIGSSTDSTRAEVWLKLPSLPAQSTARVYMYFNNPTATTSKSMANTFLAADDFEDGNITEYSGQTTLFNVRSNFAYGDSYGLDSGGNETSRTNSGGIYNLSQTVSQGETYRFKKYIDTTTGTGDEACAKFGVQATTNNNYGVCFEQFGVDRISLVKNVVDNETSGTVLASSSVTFATGWYEVEVKWRTNNTFTVTLYNAVHTQVASFGATDSSYTTGGVGFSYWYHYGGWDDIGSRPTLTSEPTVRFGAKQGRNGASWKAAIDTSATYAVGDVARIRVAIENTGLQITNQQLRLEYAAMGAAASCEAVSASNYSAVPIQASCGTSPVCMQTTSNYADGATIADLLTGARGTFTAGKAVESPSNKTGSLTINQDAYTEAEYAVTPTSNASDQNYCFRVTNNGTMYDTYLRVPRLSLRFDPIITTPTLNLGQNINLLPGTTTRTYATTTVTDFNGYADFLQGTSTIYRSGATGGAACTANNNDCYRSSCSFTNCSGNSCTLSCYADIYYFADPTDSGAYSGQDWYAFLEVRDTAGGNDFDTSPSVDLLTTRAINVTGPISYGSVAANANTGSTNASSTVYNQGNVGINLEILGTDLTGSGSSVIPAPNQKFATSTFTYSTCTTCQLLSSTTPVSFNVNMSKPTAPTPAVQKNIYWGVAVPLGTKSTAHSGINTFTPI